MQQVDDFAHVMETFKRFAVAAKDECVDDGLLKMLMTPSTLGSPPLSQSELPSIIFFVWRKQKTQLHGQRFVMFT